MSSTGKPSEKRPCSLCKGTGRCVKCGGDGERTIHRRWPHEDTVSTCTTCDGSGECRSCNGSGSVGKRPPERERERGDADRW